MIGQFYQRWLVLRVVLLLLLVEWVDNSQFLSSHTKKTIYLIIHTLLSVQGNHTWSLQQHLYHCDKAPGKVVIPGLCVTLCNIGKAKFDKTCLKALTFESYRVLSASVFMPLYQPSLHTSQSTHAHFGFYPSLDFSKVYLRANNLLFVTSNQA